MCTVGSSHLSPRFLYVGLPKESGFCSLYIGKDGGVFVLSILRPLGFTVSNITLDLSVFSKYKLKVGYNVRI